MARCPKCKKRFPTLEDEEGMHECPRCGYDGQESDEQEPEAMTIHRIIYTVECEVTFTDAELKDVEDLRSFRDYVTSPRDQDSWVTESVRDGNFVVKNVRYERMEEKQ
jgi:hypothetical protein